MNQKNRAWPYIRKIIIPVIILIIFVIAYLYAPRVEIVSEYLTKARLILSILMYLIGGWILIRIINHLFEAGLNKHFKISKKDNLQERAIQTKLRYIKAIVNIIVWLVVLGLILSLFDRLQTLGTSILASAGIAGIIIGLAAQKPLSNLIAGFIVAFSQPIRIDDAVVIEGEWGWVEEITLAHVVVKLWDKRRLVVPIGYFVEKPFQNWTKKTAAIIGSVMLYTDYSIPVDKLRKELSRILKSTELWDRETEVIQVTDTTEKCVELRILVSARNSPDAWDLRCIVREKMIEYIRKNYPEALPITRAEIKKK